ncbi:hypothetical protein Forpi1262_v002634 [Fusarium oxysporum f. sp. raphani]|uniref:Uncharacterized protein n=1 Tax=Fusarium oxysporum f. sp. raphani TaxID=96318 RepID=A0A8J5Q944_FUSOX|nr:hypothetical protein Forpi1262_v002634 [Fusarium oxysporum f. sp. raphani]
MPRLFPYPILAGGLLSPPLSPKCPPQQFGARPQLSCDSVARRYLSPFPLPHSPASVSFPLPFHSKLLLFNSSNPRPPSPSPSNVSFPFPIHTP